MLSTSDKLSPELAVRLRLSRRIPGSLWLGFPCSHRLPFLALSLQVQILTVPGVGVLACGEYTHVELRSAGFLVFFSLWHSLDQASYSGLAQVGQVPTPELQPQAQALGRLGNATTELRP